MVFMVAVVELQRGYREKGGGGRAARTLPLPRSEYATPAAAVECGGPLLMSKRRKIHPRA
jgi:hypothetical protein